MRGTYRVRRQAPDSPDTWNPATMQHEPAFTTIYEGPGRLRAANTQSRNADAGDQAFSESRYTLSLPMAGSAGIEKGDVVECVADPSDPDLAGRRFVVAWPTAESDATARRIPVEETR